MQPWEMITIIVGALVILGTLAWVFYNRRRSRNLQARFGSEYDRAVAEFGNRRRAESDLASREARVSKLDIRPLTSSDRNRFRDGWMACQSHFVDDPANAVYEADDLILEIMHFRRYPAEDAVACLEDISAVYPWLAEDYRQARELVARHRGGNGSTEEMRQAMVHYRKIFEEFLEEGKDEKFKRAS